MNRINMNSVGARAKHCGKDEMLIMSLVESMMMAVRPDAVLKREQIKNEIARLRADTTLQNAKESTIKAKESMLNGLMDTMNQVSNSGYSNGAASRQRTWAVEYHSDSGSPKKDIEENRKLLRERSRDLCMNAPLAMAAVSSTRTNCVGPGLVPIPRIDYDFLGISKEEAQELEKLIKKEFSLWAESTLCDNNDQNNFYELQQIVFNDWLRNGEEFVLIRYGEELSYMPYQLRLKLVEADRVCTPGSLDGEYDGYDKKESNGNIVMNGVEIDQNGQVAAYHIASHFPGEEGLGNIEWERVEKRGKKTGNPNILHVFNGERAEQYRGVPFLAPVIQTLKQLTRYSEAEIMAAVINSMFSIFITTETGNDMVGFRGLNDEPEDEAVNGEETPEEDRILVGSGTVNFLKNGEGVQTVESTHPSGNYEAFVSAMCNYIGAALEIAPEILLKKFSNNFSASKGALNETWKAFRMRRKWFVDDFCQSVYELWLNEAVSKGRIQAPGYFNNPLIRKAYANAKWNGPTQGHLNPMQEVNAAVSKIENGLSTHADECNAMNGSSFEDNVRTLQSENEMLLRAKRIVKEDKEDGSEN